MKSKLKLIFGTLFKLFTISVLILGVYLAYYLYNETKDVKEVVFTSNEEKVATFIYDKDDLVVKTINQDIKRNVSYDELSDHFINALVSIEDIDFFSHDGINYRRILISLYQNLMNGKIVAGGSTLTQQLIKNVTDEDDKTLSRKIKEAYQALNIEKKYTKEEILTLYANQIRFDGVNKGVNTASLRFFNKNIGDVTLPEAALLAALVKSPTYYNPYTQTQRANERKNLVLGIMHKCGYISYEEMNSAQSISVEELLTNKTVTIKQDYPYQAYLDLVYQQVKDLTGYDPYFTPMKIYTYLDSELQQQLDKIQKGEDKSITYYDENQQLGASVIDNASGAIIGVIGGRNYQGEKLFNRSYNMKRQPASTIKPLLSYALAIEYLDWSNIHVVDDAPFKYPYSEIDVRNVDGRYMGQLFLEEALGYSRNTTALSTLKQVTDKIGARMVAEYLDNIGLLDVSPELYNYAYGLGGMYEGVSPVQLAAAYRVLATDGVYKTPTSIKKIELLDDSKKIIYPTINENKVLSQETTFLLTDLLTTIVNKNYWGIGYVKVNNVQVAAKTGTSSFDDNQSRILGYPKDANKDIWYGGFTPDISLAVWTGFDKSLPYQKTYFDASGDIRVTLARSVFKRIIEIKAKRYETFIPPNTLQKVKVVKGMYPYVLGDELTPSSMLIEGYFKTDHIPVEKIKMPPLEKMKEPQVLLTNNELEINFLDNVIINPIKKEGKVIFDYSYIYGDKTYFVDVFVNGNKIATYKTSANQLIIKLDQIGEYNLKMYYRYEKDTKITLPSFELSFYNFDVINGL